jgi:hypothetical protein
VKTADTGTKPPKPAPSGNTPPLFLP